MKKKVLFLTTQFGQGGVERSLIDACKVIDPEKYDITLLLRYNKTMLTEFLPDYVKVIVVKDGHYYYRPKSLAYSALKKITGLFGNKEKSDDYGKKLEEYVYGLKVSEPAKKYFKNEYFDYIVSYTVHTCTEIALNIKGGKHFCFYHSDDPEFHKDITARAFPKYDKIIACGPGVEILLRNTFPELNDKIELLSNYIDAPKVMKKAAEFNPYEKEKSLVIATCARLEPEKGYDLAVKAAKKLNDNGIDFKWYIIGEGSQHSAIQELIDECGLSEKMIMTGNLNNPFPYIRNCDIYAHTSYSEAQPLSILEAIVLGKAIVSTDNLGGVTVLENGKKGLLVRTDSDSIYDGIMKFINDPEYKESFEDKYTLEQNMREKEEYARNWAALLN